MNESQTLPFARINVNGVPLGARVRPDGRVIDDRGRAHPLDEISWLSPVTGTVIGVTSNFRPGDAEREEPRGEPTLFIKAPSSLIGHHGVIQLPNPDAEVYFETELCAVLGKRCFRVPRREALYCVGGYTIINDVTMPVPDAVGPNPPLIAKSRATFGPVGPYIVPAADVPDPEDVEVRTTVNGVVVQQGNTKQLIFGIAHLIEYISSFMVLEPGDAIATGTPVGRGVLRPGDVVSSEVQHVGELVNSVDLLPFQET